MPKRAWIVIPRLVRGASLGRVARRTLPWCTCSDEASWCEVEHGRSLLAVVVTAWTRRHCSGDHTARKTLASPFHAGHAGRSRKQALPPFGSTAPGRRRAWCGGEPIIGRRDQG